MKRSVAMVGLMCVCACGSSTLIGQGNNTGATSAGGNGTTTSSSSGSGAGGSSSKSSASSSGSSSVGGSGQGSSVSSSSSGAGGMAGCNPACDLGLACCGSTCVNKGNDILNCGACGKKCDGAAPFCDGGTCGKPPSLGAICAGDQTCCGLQCCKAGQLCCSIPRGVVSGPKCVEPVNGSCAPGCPGCKCAAPNTPIATPTGERAIAALRPGDLVYSVDRGEVRAVRIIAVKRLPVSHHLVMRIALETGRVLSISAEHPLADGRLVRDLRAGDLLHGVGVLSAELVPYEFDSTYDIYPDSDSGTYFAAGALMGSTLFGRTTVPDQCLRP